MFNKHRKHSGFLNRLLGQDQEIRKIYVIMSSCLWGGKSKKWRVLLNMYTNSTHYFSFPPHHAMLEQFAVSSNVPHISVFIAIVKIIRLFHIWWFVIQYHCKKILKGENLVKTSKDTSKETPTCLVIFLILRKLKTKPNGPLGSSTQAELTIVSTSQTKHLILWARACYEQDWLCRG